MVRKVKQAAAGMSEWAKLDLAARAEIEREAFGVYAQRGVDWLYEHRPDLIAAYEALTLAHERSEE